MKFHLMPIIEQMLALYKKPRAPERFHEYLSMLQGNTAADLLLPIAGFNPMAKEHALEKLQELKSLGAESLITEILGTINDTAAEDGTVINVALNLADDLKGGWTNRYATDFDSKFKINGLVTRNFCVPYFWTSEDFDAEKIRTRAQEYVYRTIFWKKHGRLETLKDHLEQEVFVAKHVRPKSGTGLEETEELSVYFDKHQMDDNYSRIFNFFYGDKISATLGYPLFDTRENAGFEFAKWLAGK